jgi:gliding motility-associated-like protein
MAHKGEGTCIETMGLRTTIIALLLPFAWNGLMATHIIGGEMYYDHMGGNDYLLTLDLYRDCSPANSMGTGFDNQVQIGIFTGTGQFLFNQNITFPGEQIVPVVISNPCLTAPPNICIATARYQTVLNLPPIAAGYHISYQRCCRTPAILNLQAAGNQGLTCTAQIPGIPNSVNSSPRYNDYPPVVLCVGEEMVFDHSANDPDGDVLVYELCNPLLGGSNANPAPAPGPPPYAPVNWAAGYSALDPIPGAPPLQIDANTGQLTVTPTQVGVYSVGVCVKEYRGGVLLSEVSRDFMFTVVACDPNIISVVSDQDPAAICNGLTQDFGNQSINGQFWFWDFGDPTTNADTSSLDTPSWTYSAGGSYTVTLIANPGWPCADTSTAVYSVGLPLDPVFVPPASLCGPSEVELAATGNFTAAADVSWDLGATTTPTTAEGAQITANFEPVGPQPVTVTVTENGCTDSFTTNLTVDPIPVAAIAPQSVFCTGLSVTFGNDSQGATTYAWDFGDPSTATDVSMAFEPTWTYAAPGNYTVTLTADPAGPCPNTTTSLFSVFVDITPYFEVPPILCPGQVAELVVTGNFSPGADIQWDFSAAGFPQNGTGLAVVPVYATPGIHPVSVTITDMNCSGTFTDSVRVFPYPVADFTSDTRACVGEFFAFQDLSTAWTPLSYEWDLGDGNMSNDAAPVHQYTSPGLYTVSLTVSTDSGCVASNTLVRNGQVMVYPNPVAAFSALPREVSVFDPFIEVKDLSLGSVLWYYTIEGQEVLTPSFTHDFSDGGQYEIVQWVTSADGCTDSTSRIVFVSDHVFYAPNAFTPDGDGLNDTWAPRVLGARDYELVIYDRWGVECFRSNDPKAEWAGDGYTQGVYIYTARIKEWGAYSKEYQGHFSLLR